MSADHENDVEALRRVNAAQERLVLAVQQLSLARSVEAIQAIVRHAAREIAGADGATFVLRDGDKCFYADEEAISPLWKGQRFPLSACISGWAMLNRQHVAIEDIYADSRIPIDAYRPTFVKSLVMVPIRVEDPIGAIGTYWSSQRRASVEEVRVLQALANTTSVAIENVQMYAELEQRVATRTQQLEDANRELEAFSYSVSHDLRAPLRAISGFTDLLVCDLGTNLTVNTSRRLETIKTSAARMNRLIEDLLQFSKVSRKEVRRSAVDLATVAREVVARFRAENPEHMVEMRIPESLPGRCDPGLIGIVMENLISNAWKYSSKVQAPVIEIGSKENAESETVFYVRDNGAGFSMRYAEKLFAPFQRMHSETEFPGTGIGLATVQRIVARHGGRIWAEAEENKGATFYFTIPSQDGALHASDLG